MVRRIGGNVGDMDNLFSAGHEIEAAPSARPYHGFAAAEAGVRRRDPVLRNNRERAILIQMQISETGLANPDCVRQHSLEYRLQFARRTRNDLQYFRCRCLLLQCLGQLAGADFKLLFQIASVRLELRY